MIWLSPAFPVGAFAYSHGLELAVERAWVRNGAGIDEWLSDLVSHGSLRNDLILFAEAWRAATHEDGKRLQAVNDIAIAMQPSSERLLETAAQGGAFVAAMQSSWPVSIYGQLNTRDIAYPVAVGAAIGAHGLELTSALLAYAIAFTQNLVSACIRLSLFGQSEGQRILAAVLPRLQRGAFEAAGLALDDLGSSTPRSDIASMLHETQYTRLFRS
ncbi:MAG: urease accessory protein UreF [Hyphomicrobiaceae bacterium]